MTGAPAPALLKGHLVNLSGPRQKLTPSCVKQHGKESTRSLPGLLLPADPTESPWGTAPTSPRPLICHFSRFGTLKLKGGVKRVPVGLGLPLSLCGSQARGWGGGEEYGSESRNRNRNQTTGSQTRHETCLLAPRWAWRPLPWRRGAGSCWGSRPPQQRAG